MSFTKRRIDVTINLAQGEFGEHRGSDVTLSGYRTQAAIVGYTGDAQTQLQLRIHGLTQNMMNQLTTIGPLFTERRANRILVAAGDVGDTALTVAYEGTIAQAWANYNHAPEVAFNVIAMAGALDAVKPVRARSYRGSVAVAEILADIAAEMGLTLQIHSVTTRLANPYFPGTAVDQLRACARAARFHYTMDRGALVVWQRDQARADAPILVQAGHNLIGYPAFTGGGVEFSLMYTPTLGIGQKVQVVSVIEPARGEWSIVSLSHQIEAETPGGRWQSNIVCQRIPESGTTP